MRKKISSQFNIVHSSSLDAFFMDSKKEHEKTNVYIYIFIWTPVAIEQKIEFFEKGFEMKTTKIDIFFGLFGMTVFISFFEKKRGDPHWEVNFNAFCRKPSNLWN